MSVFAVTFSPRSAPIVRTTLPRSWYHSTQLPERWYHSTHNLGPLSRQRQVRCTLTSVPLYPRASTRYYRQQYQRGYATTRGEGRAVPGLGGSRRR
eukprot:2878901-Rhodomonas_salina.1